MVRFVGGGHVSRLLTLPKTQEQDEDGRVCFVYIALLQFLEAALHFLLDGVVELALNMIEHAFHDVDETWGQVDDRLSIDDRRLRPSKHNSAKDHLEVLR